MIPQVTPEMATHASTIKVIHVQTNYKIEPAWFHGELQTWELSQSSQIRPVQADLHVELMNETISPS